MYELYFGVRFSHPLLKKPPNFGGFFMSGFEIEHKVEHK